MSNPLTASIRSDSLVLIRKFIGEHPLAATLGSILKVRVVLDANSVLNELRWIHKKRKNPSARSDLREILAAGVAVAYAPRILEEEVVRHFDEFSHRWEISRSDLEASWAEFRALIRWVDPRPLPSPPGMSRDPTDEPYVQLALQIGAGVVTRDEDFASFAVPVVTREVVLEIKTYARFTATEMNLKVVGFAAVQITPELFQLANRLVRQVWESFKRLPVEFQILICALLAAALLDERIRTSLKKSIEQAGRFGMEVLHAVAMLAEQAEVAAQGAKSALKSYPDTARRPRALIDYAVVACTEADSPVTAEFILMTASLNGYAVRSDSTLVYLNRILARDNRFERTADGRWTIAAKPLGPAV